MPMITVQMFPGRTAERLTDVFLQTCGQPNQSRDGVWVVIDEVPREHWAVGGRLGVPRVE